MDLENESLDTLHYGPKGFAGELDKVTELADLGSGHLGSSFNGRTLPTRNSAHDPGSPEHIGVALERPSGMPRLPGARPKSWSTPAWRTFAALPGHAALRLPAASRNPRAALVASHRQSQSIAPEAVTAWQNHRWMAAVKVTLSLSPETVELLSDAATRLGIPKSQVVRDAIQESHAGIDRLSSAEQVRMLEVLDEFAATPATRSDDDVQRELAEIREARHGDTGRARFE